MPAGTCWGALASREDCHHLGVETFDQAVLVTAGVGPERLGRVDQDLVGVGAEHRDGLVDELLQRQGLLSASCRLAWVIGDR
jgi:hypothetical protein